MSNLTLPALPYETNALEPTIGQATVELHHGKHHNIYFVNLNNLIDGTDLAGKSLEEIITATTGDTSKGKIFNNAGQAWNHIIYWEQFQPGGADAPTGKLAEMINRDFGSFNSFKEQFVAAAAGVFGSGWAWLAEKDGKLEILGTQGGDNPLAHGKKTLMGIDIWEHAYYLDFQNRRPDHVKAVLNNLINWDYVADRLG